MTWTLIANGCTQSGTSSITLNTTGADLIVVVTDGNGSFAGSDSLGNEYTQTNDGNALVSTARVGISLYYCQNPTVGANCVFTGINVNSPISVQAWSGSLSTGSFDVFSNTVITSAVNATAVTTSSLAPSGIDELCIVYYAIDDPTDTGTPAYSINDGFTITSQVVERPGIYFGGVMGYKVQPDASAASPTLTRSNPASIGDIGALAFFKPESIPVADTMDATGNSYSIKGQGPSFSVGHNLSASGGTYQTKGVEVTLIKGTLTTFNAPPGAYSMEGKALSLNSKRSITATSGKFSLTGVPTTLSFTGRVTMMARSGKFSLAGVPVSIVSPPSPFVPHVVYDKMLLGGVSKNTPVWNSKVIPRKASRIVNTRALRLLADSGSYAILGIPPHLEDFVSLILSNGGYGINGTAPSFHKAYNSFVANTGSYAVASQSLAPQATVSFTAAELPGLITGLLDPSINSGSQTTMYITSAGGVSTMEFTVTGSSAEMTLWCNLAAFDISIDGGAWSILQGVPVNSVNTTVPIFQGLSDTKHIVRMVINAAGGSAGFPNSGTILSVTGSAPSAASLTVDGVMSYITDPTFTGQHTLQSLPTANLTLAEIGHNLNPAVTATTVPSNFLDTVKPIISFFTTDPSLQNNEMQAGGSIVFNAKCEEIWVWTPDTNTLFGIDGAALTHITMEATPTDQFGQVPRSWKQVASGLDGTTTHQYYLSQEWITDAGTMAVMLKGAGAEFVAMDKKPVIVQYGDSITYADNGVRADGARSDVASSVIHHIANRYGYLGRNIGIQGFNFTNFDQDFALWRQVNQLTGPEDVAIISLGNNDGTVGEDGTPQEANLSVHITNSINQVISLGVPRIIVQTNPYGSNTADPTTVASVIKSIVGGYTNADITLLDTSGWTYTASATNPTGIDTIDGAHPTTEGFFQIAALELPALEEFFAPLTIVGYGQSWMGQMMSGTTVSTSNAQVWDANTNSWQTLVADGLAPMADYLNSVTGKKVRVVAASLTGAPADQLAPGTATFTTLSTAITASGIDNIDSIVWEQHDSPTESSPESYAANVESIHSAIMSLINKTTSNTPFLYGGLYRNTDPTDTIDNDGTFAYEAHRENFSVLINNNQYISHNQKDIATIDGAHFTTDGLATVGRRFAWSILNRLGIRPSLAKFSIGSAAITNTTTTAVTVVHGSGTDFTPTSNISGFEVSADNGGTWANATGSHANSTTITLAHSSIGTLGRLVRYQYGRAPDVTSPVYDNSGVTAPLMFTDASIIASGGSVVAPTLTDSRALQTSDNLTFSTALVSLGAPAANRYIIAGLKGCTSLTPIVSFTIAPNVGSPIVFGPNDAVIGQEQDPNVSPDAVSIFSAALPEDAANADFATVTVVYNGNPFTNIFVNIWMVPTSNLVSTATAATRVANVTSGTVNLSVNDNDFITTIAMVDNNDSVFSGTGSFNSSIMNNTVGHLGIVADASFLTANSTSAVTVTSASNEKILLAAVAWHAQ